MLNLQLLPPDRLSAYAKIMYHYSKYLHATKQSAHFILNSNKEILWMCMLNKKNKYSAIGTKLNADKMAKGTVVSDYNDQK